ncbi:MAG: hypothetical protein LBU46_04665 [Candidatus Accumulibacter sp.]|nr:hypothetical protein [Accumulibacter sp.]
MKTGYPVAWIAKISAQCTTVKTPASRLTADDRIIAFDFLGQRQAIA